jgi:hypothetical protein
MESRSLPFTLSSCGLAPSTGKTYLPKARKEEVLIADNTKGSSCGLACSIPAA